MVQGDGEWVLKSVHHMLSLPLLPPHGEDSSCSSPVPVWALTHGRQSFTNFTSVGLSHGFQFFMNCCSVDGVYCFRKRLFQCGAPTRSQELQHGVSMGSSLFQGSYTSSDMESSMGCRGTIFITTVFTMGCRGISAPELGPPPPPPSLLTLVSAKLFVSHVFSLLSPSYCWAVFFSSS